MSAHNGTEYRLDEGRAAATARFGARPETGGNGIGAGAALGADSEKLMVKGLLHFGHLADLPSALPGTEKAAPQWEQLVRLFSDESAMASPLRWSSAAPRN